MDASVQHTPCFSDPTFPNSEQYNFKILKTRQVDTNLSIVVIGVERGISLRVWNLALGTPTSTVEQIITTKHQGTTHQRFLIKPDYYNSVHGSDFHQFLDHIEGVSEKIGKLLHDNGHIVNN